VAGRLHTEINVWYRELNPDTISTPFAIKALLERLLCFLYGPTGNGNEYSTADLLNGVRTSYLRHTTRPCTCHEHSTLPFCKAVDIFSVVVFAQ